MKLKIAVTPFSVRSSQGDLSENGTADKIKLIALAGAHVSAHITVRTEKREKFTLTASDGKSQDGATYGAVNIAIYAEKGISIDRNWHHNGLPTCVYTDALLPLDTAVRYGETVADKDKTAIFLADFFVPEDTAAGVYSGHLTVNGVSVTDVPYVLTVLSAKQPQETTSKSLFAVNLVQVEHYEGSRSQDMLDKYVQTLIDHRLATGFVAVEDFSPEGCKRYARSAAEWVKRGLSTVGLPAIPKDEGGTEYPDFSILFDALLALAAESLNAGVNLVKYTAFFDWLIDEPFLAKMPDGKVERCVKEFNDTIESITAQLSADARFGTDFGGEIIAALKNIPHIITDYSERRPKILSYTAARQVRDKNGNPYMYSLKEVTLCPKFDGYDDAFKRVSYEENAEKWWYGCNAPSAPYVSYHMDDAPWAPRYIGWLMARYGVTGNVYWVVNYGQEINTTGSPLYLDDPYGTAHRGFGANGDGVLLYPGKYYGLDNPVGCLRLKAIRDGNADYEWLKKLFAGYRAKGRNFGKIFDRMTAPFAQGVRVDTFAGGFEEAADCFIRLYDAFINCSLTIECTDQADYTVFYVDADGADVTVDGKPVNGEIKIPRREGYAVMEVKLGGYASQIPLWVGGNLTVVLHEELYEAMAVTGNAAKIEPLRHDIYRELTVMPKDAITEITVALPVTLYKNRVGVEIRAYDGAEVTVTAGKSSVKKRFADEWGRIDCPIDGTDKFVITFAGDKSIALGAVYIH